MYEKDQDYCLVFFCILQILHRLCLVVASLRHSITSVGLEFVCNSIVVLEEMFYTDKISEKSAG